MTTDIRMAALIAFYSARLDEDEELAKAAADVDPQGIEDYSGAWTTDAIMQRTHWSYQADEHVARHDPARVLREVAAGRAAVKRYELAAAAASRGSMSSFVHGQDDGYAEACLDAIRDAVAVWGEHPDYDPAWRMDP